MVTTPYFGTNLCFTQAFSAHYYKQGQLLTEYSVFPSQVNMIWCSRCQPQRSHVMLPCSILVEVGKYSRYITKFLVVFFNKTLSATINMFMFMGCSLLAITCSSWEQNSCCYNILSWEGIESLCLQLNFK